MKLTAFLAKYGTDAACRAHLESVRWPNGPVCPFCGSTEGASPIRTRVGLSSKGISSVKLGEHLGVTQKTAWFLGHRIRALLDSGEKLPLSGIIEADESCIGCKAKNLDKSAARPEKPGRGTKKPMIFAAIERGGEARVAVIRSAKIDDIAPNLWCWTNGGAAVLMSDELASYRWIGRKMLGHHVVNHSQAEYARIAAKGLKAHVNTAEGFFGLVKRAIVGVWHQVSAKHLHRYTGEHEFRWKRRMDDSADRVARCLIGRHGRLRWKDLVA